MEIQFSTIDEYLFKWLLIKMHQLSRILTTVCVLHTQVDFNAEDARNSWSHPYSRDLQMPRFSHFSLQHWRTRDVELTLKVGKNPNIQMKLIPVDVQGDKNSYYVIRTFEYISYTNFSKKSVWKQQPWQLGYSMTSPFDTLFSK